MIIISLLQLIFYEAAITYELMDNYKEALKLYKRNSREISRSLEARDIDKYISQAETALMYK